MAPSLLLLAALACSKAPEAPAEPPAAAAPAAAPKYVGLFQPLPAVAAPADAAAKARVDLGHALYTDARLSKNQDVSCNSCHKLDAYGVDNEPTSPGHKGQRGGRNSPTSYNAFLHVAQFWDGRAPDVEAQALGPVTNPIEMAMKDDKAVDALLRSIPGYAPMFAAAFPGEAEPVSFANAAKAIGAFERTLVTPGPFDRYLAGDVSALTAEQQAGLDTFVSTGCASCHMGAGVGGGMYQKLGLVVPYDTKDEGRKAVTKNDADLHVFKVPALRNVEKTAPYFHDGSVATLDDAIRKMGKHQLGKDLADSDVASIKSFLGSLTGPLPTLTAPTLPPSGPNTPKPDPT
ncbi:MAG: hypothetical protein RLZZ299_257 [Pseudomonadota bacterium]|jgi:cytochrome c peroxidase